MNPSKDETIENLWTCVATCQVCGKELNRAKHIPESKKGIVTIQAPLVAVCGEKGHSTFSDCNPGVILEWQEEL